VAEDSRTSQVAGCRDSANQEQSVDLLRRLVYDVANERGKPPLIILSLSGLICTMAIAMAVMIRRPI
jgi:hypothetical protein